MRGLTRTQLSYYSRTRCTGWCSWFCASQYKSYRNNQQDATMY